MRIVLGDISFYSDEYPGDSGFVFADWAGWTDGPGQKRDSAPRPNAPGSFPARSYATDRVFTWRGRYRGASLADVSQSGERLTGLEGQDVRVEVQGETVRWADATVDRVRFSEHGYAPRADYQVELWLADPRKYGATSETVSTGGAVTVSHAGNTAAHQRFEVAGAMSGYSLTSGGKAFAVPGPLGAGQVDEVDFRTGIVKRDGALVLGVSPRTWEVPAGANISWSLTPAGGSGTATSFLTDTYI